MKARKKGSDYEFEEVKFVQLEGADILFKHQLNMQMHLLNNLKRRKENKHEDSDRFRAKP